MLVYNNELTRQDSSGVDIAGEWLKTLIVAKDLRGRGSWHRGDKE